VRLPRRCCPNAECELCDCATSDFFYAFVTYPRALAFSQRRQGAANPLALIRQREYIDEPTPGVYKHIRKVRITEWPIEFLSRPRRNRNTIPRPKRRVAARRPR
jgi:hypothetical protein